MAIINDPRKSFNFSIRMAGLNEFLAQKVTLPEINIEKVQHGETNHQIKTAGQLDVGDLTIEKISPVNFPENYVWDWILQVQDVLTGGGQLASIYKRNCSIFQYAPDNRTVVAEWLLIGVWPARVNGVELSRLDSVNVIETIEFSVDKYDKL